VHFSLRHEHFLYFPAKTGEKFKKAATNAVKPGKSLPINRKRTGKKNRGGTEKYVKKQGREQAIAAQSIAITMANER
jgi:hypothetical protein